MVVVVVVVVVEPYDWQPGAGTSELVYVLAYRRLWEKSVFCLPGLPSTGTVGRGSLWTPKNQPAAALIGTSPRNTGGTQNTRKR